MAPNLLARSWMESASFLPVPADARPDRSRPAVDRQSALRLTPPVAGRVPISMSLGVADALFSPNRLPFVLLDFAVVSFAFLHAAANSASSSAGTRLFAADLIFSSAFAVTALGIGFYDRLRRFEWLNILGGSVAATFVACAVCVGYVQWNYLSGLRLPDLLNGASTSLLAIVALHLVLGALLRENPYRFTILGRSPYMDEVKGFARRSRGFRQPFSHVPWEQLSNGHPPTAATLHAAGVGEVVLTNESLRNPENVDLAIGLLQLECRVIDETEFYIQMFERLPIDAVTKRWILERGIARRKVVAAAIKRTVDLVIATVALTLLLPFFALIALAIKVSSRGPVLFVQARQGHHSVPFRMYKFRTMHADRGSPSGQDGFTKDGDARVTWIGRLLRPFHLDELPQLWNVIRGQMSLVGPRPEALSFAERMTRVIPLYELRYLVRPGLTGYAQISQGYAMDSVVDTKRKLSYDLYYLCHHSIWTDLNIMVRTLFVLAKGAR